MINRIYRFRDSSIIRVDRPTKRTSNFPNLFFVFSEITKFSADEAVGQTELSCDNASQFSADDYVMLGQVGNDTTEMNQISSVGSDLKTITLKSATKHVHAEGALITKMLFNQRKFYRSTTESGTYTHLTTEGSPVDIEVDGPSGTLLEDSTGTSTSRHFTPSCSR